MPEPPLLSVVIVNWNVRELLRSCLRSIAREMRLPRAEWEVIVVDNASADASVEMLHAEFPEVTVIASAVNLGFGAGCNRAFRVARGEFILLLNPDTELVHHAADGLLALMRSRPRAGVVAPRLVHGDGAPQSAAGGALPTLVNVAWHYLFLREVLPARLGPAPLFLGGDPREVMAIEWVSGASMMLRREALGETIFDESFFMFGEDMDLCDRVRRAGWQVLYDGTTSVLHHHGKSFEKQGSLEVRANAHDGPRRVFAKHRGTLSVAAYDAILLVAFLVRWPLFRVLSWVRPGHGFDARSIFCRTYVRAMLQGPPARAASPRRE